MHRFTSARSVEDIMIFLEWSNCGNKKFNGERSRCIRRIVQGVEGAEATKSKTFPVSSQMIQQNLKIAEKRVFCLFAHRNKGLNRRTHHKVCLMERPQKMGMARRMVRLRVSLKKSEKEDCSQHNNKWSEFFHHSDCFQVHRKFKSYEPVSDFDFFSFLVVFGDV